MLLNKVVFDYMILNPDLQTEQVSEDVQFWQPAAQSKHFLNEPTAELKVDTGQAVEQFPL